MKEINSAISGQNCKMVPVPNRGGTGTHDTEPKWYRYHDKVVLVPLTITGLVPVPIQVVPIPLLLATLIFGILTLLSSNSYTDGIETLINDWWGFK